MHAMESADSPPHHQPLQDARQTKRGNPIAVRSHFNEISYGRVVRNVKDCIAAGEVYQVCMTHRLESPLENASAWDLYCALREINPAPFAGFLKFPEVEVVSSSPERFLKLDRDRLAESRPIKGTRPRGKTTVEDERLRNELFSSAKDRAENVMIVDLVRNDFGRVCRYGSVRVRDFLAVEPYATVFQMVSTVEGRLAEELDRFDLIRACFPGGSMTGAPKIEAMKIIDRLEPVARGIYSGAIGYLDFSGAMDLGMVIRTILVKDGQCFYHVGGGIVADSDPQAEYVETQDKARALIKAIGSLKNPRPEHLESQGSLGKG
jgi:aminodeoxychorismate synthase component I